MARPRLSDNAKVPGAIVQKRCDDDVRWKAEHNERGYLYELDGRTFYSPNCCRKNLALPPPVIDPNDGIIRGRDFQIAPFLQPQWWTKAHGYLAFVPLRPDFSPSPLHPLLRLPRVRYNRTGRYAFPDPFVWDSWKGLQEKIVESVHLLLNRSAAPAVRPAYPCARIEGACYKGSTAKAHLQEDILLALSWFSIWFGCLAYAIAVSEAMAREAKALGRRILPEWMEILTKVGDNGGPIHHVDERFVSDLPNTCVACFDSTVERVGTFVTIPDDDEPRFEEMVSIDWLCEFNVPVWYEWGPRENDIARRYPFWQRFAPRPNSVRVNRPSPTSPQSPKEVAAPSSRPTRYDVRPNLAPEERTWEEWFRLRQVRHTEILASETAQAKQRRENRERCPPTTLKKTKFFVWDKGDDGVFRRRKAEEDDLCDLFTVDGRYCRTQARYDSVFNEWDLCEYFGVPDEQKLRHMAEEDADYLGVSLEKALDRLRIFYGLVPVPRTCDAPEATTHSANEPLETNDTGASLPLSPLPQLPEPGAQVTSLPLGGHNEPPAPLPSLPLPHLPESSTQVTSPASPSHELFETHDNNTAQGHTLNPLDNTQYEPDLFAYLLYGYTAVPTEGQEPGEVMVGIGYAGKALGYHTFHEGKGFWTKPEGQALIRFLNSLAKGTPSSELWDLSRYNRIPVAAHPRFKSLRSHRHVALVEVNDWDNVDGRWSSNVSTEVTLYWFSADYGQKWRLGCVSAPVALTICRFDLSKTPVALAFELVGQGIRFHTWLEVANVCSTGPPSSGRLIKYRRRLTVFDSRDYDTYTINCRSLCKGHVGRAALLRGGIVWRLAIPYVSFGDVLSGPSSAALQGKGIVRSNGQGSFLVDDDLTVDEVDAICGHYDVYDERHLQIARFSWWPPAELWEQRYGFGGWSRDAETFYTERLKEIESNYQPLPRSEWRKRLRISSPFKALYTNIDRFSETLIGNPANGGL
ncbi:hypothetical protein DFP72DRAFT_473885 [Ephemerocybe angulata]|uniref:Uncharacterized protein n=1 Tax=Ephemerocybe angulata TaxID=980116 RepID=A0A8H6HSS4_9AGAR|nr:hypothetical protein DFP72DRAFT_473885 [Tulosesus angulatus]